MYVYDTDVLGEGHFDLISSLELSDGKSFFFIIPPDGDDALLAVIVGMELWIVSLALSEVIQTIPLIGNCSLGVINLSSQRGVLRIEFGDLVLFVDYLGNLLDTMITPWNVVNPIITTKANKMVYGTDWSIKLSSTITSFTVGENITFAGLENGSIHIFSLADGRSLGILQNARRKSPILALSTTNDDRLIAVDSDGVAWIHVPHPSKRNIIDR